MHKVRYVNLELVGFRGKDFNILLNQLIIIRISRDEDKGSYRGLSVNTVQGMKTKTYLVGIDSFEVLAFHFYNSTL